MDSGANEDLPEIRIVSTNLASDEIAAVNAVVQVALAESAELAGADETAPVSAWARDQRPIRTPLHPGPRAWNTSARH